MRLRQSLWKQELHMLMRRVEWDSQSELWLHQIMSTRTHVHALQGRTQQLCDVCLSARAGTAGRGEKHAFAIIAVIISWIYTIYTRFDNWGVQAGYTKRTSRWITQTLDRSADRSLSLLLQLTTDVWVERESQVKNDRKEDVLVRLTWRWIL